MGYDHDDEIAVPPEQHHMRFHHPSSFVETGANWMAPSYVRQTDDNRLSYHKVHQKKPKTLQQIEFKRKLERMRTSEQNIRKSMKQNDKRFEEEENAADERGKKFLDNMIPKMEKDELQWESSLEQQEVKNEMAAHERMDKEHAAEEKRLKIFEDGMKPEEAVDDLGEDQKWEKQNKMEEDFEDAKELAGDDTEPSSFLERSEVD